MSVEKKTDDLSIRLGARIRAIREQKKLRVADLADMTGLTPSMISQVERGLIAPSIATLKKIGNSLNIPLSLLFESNDEAHVNGTLMQSEALLKRLGNLEPLMKALSLIGGNGNGNGFAGQNPVVHKEQRKILSPSKGVRFYLLNPDMSGPIEFIYNEYDPGSECGLVLSGELVVQINDSVDTRKERGQHSFQRNRTSHVKECRQSDVYLYLG